jgi:hypothetical protein
MRFETLHKKMVNTLGSDRFLTFNSDRNYVSAPWPILLARNTDAETDTRSGNWRRHRVCWNRAGAWLLGRGAGLQKAVR